MISLSLKPDPVTRYASCLREEESLNFGPKLLMTFKATHVSERKKERKKERRIEISPNTSEIVFYIQYIVSVTCKKKVIKKYIFISFNFDGSMYGLCTQKGQYIPAKLIFQGI